LRGGAARLLQRGTTRTLGRMTEIVATREFRPSLRRIIQAMGEDSRAEGSVFFRRSMLVISLGCIAWIAWGFLVSGTVPLEAVASGLGAAALVWFVLVWAVPRFVESGRHVKKGLAPRRYKFDAETLFLETTDGVTLKAPYRTFAKISIGEDYVIFYETFPGLAAHVIPSDAFESKDQEKMVRDWLGVYAA